MARPSSYSDQIASAICDAVANSSRGLEWICGNDDSFPSARTVWRWMEENAEFRQQYARAKERQADFMADEILDISDDGLNDYVTLGLGDEAKLVVNHDHIQRSRLRVDSRKWLMSKLAPKKYGDKLELGGSLNITHEDALEQLK